MLGTGLDSQLWQALEDAKIFQDLAARYFMEDYKGQLGFSNMGHLLRAAKWAGLEKNKIGLDLFCGNGRPGLFIMQRNRCRLAGFDLSINGLKVGQYRADRYGLSEKASFVQGNINQPLPFASRAFDGVLALEGFPKEFSQTKIFREIKRVLKPGGGLAFFQLFTTGENGRANNFPVYDLQTSLKLLVEEGFKEIQSFEVTGELKALIPRMKKGFEERGVLERLQDSLGNSITNGLYNEVLELNLKVNQGKLERWFITAKKPDGQTAEI